MEKNMEIEELESKISNMSQLTKKLRKENRDLNKEALDLENKIRVMDKMYSNLQVNYDKGAEQRISQTLEKRNSEIAELNTKISSLKTELDQCKETQKLSQNNQNSRDVSTDSIDFMNFEIESPEIRYTPPVFCN